MNDSIRHTADFLKKLRSEGRYAFSMDDLIKAVPKSVKNLRKDIDRLKGKGEVLNIRREFSIILPDEYRNMGTLPVEFYINELMLHLNKNYYAGLYSAAMFLGAAHQQPQEFAVISQFPKPRMVEGDKLRINFFAKRNFPLFGIENRKTDTGYFKISGPELTFLDLIYFEQALGGYNRTITILKELAETIGMNRMKETLNNDFPVSTIQRAGFISGQILENNKLATLFANFLSKKNPQRILLKSSGSKEGLFDLKWKIVVNTQIEGDI
jgi:predicted transcriptional regulator of viral defense system